MPGTSSTLGSTSYSRARVPGFSDSSKQGHRHTFACGMTKYQFRRDMLSGDRSCCNLVLSCILILYIYIIRAWHFSKLRDRVCSIFSGTGKFCLAHGLRQLT